MTDPSVSVVVPSFRGAERLPMLLEGFRAQTFQGEWEMVVVLDGVVDESVELLDAVDDVPVRVVVLPENRGRPAALNAGFAEARGDIFVRCDDDLGVQPSYLALHAEAHTDGGSVGIVGLCHDVLPDNAYARAYGRPSNERLRKAAYEKPPDRWWTYWAANCSIPAETYARVGPYDEGFRVYGWEDVDWGYRLHLLGVPVLLEPRLEVLHLAASSTATIRVERAFQGGRARARFERKHGIEPELLKPSGVVPNLWAAAIAGATRAGSQERFAAAGEWVDRVGERLPSPVLARLIALLVEAASETGHRSAPATETNPVR